MIRDEMRGVNAFAVQSCRRNLVTNYSKVLLTNLTQTRRSAFLFISETV